MDAILPWGFVATVMLTTALCVTQGTGCRTPSLPFLFGSIFTGDRYRANVIGFPADIFGGSVRFRLLRHLCGLGGGELVGRCDHQVHARPVLARGLLARTPSYPSPDGRRIRRADLLSPDRAAGIQGSELRPADTADHHNRAHSLRMGARHSVHNTPLNSGGATCN